MSATTSDPRGLGLLRRRGVVGWVMDGLDPFSVGEIVAAAQPDVIVNQMSGLSVRRLARVRRRAPDACFVAANRLRTEGVDHLLAAAEAVGVRRIVTHSHGDFHGVGDRWWPRSVSRLVLGAEELESVTHLERAVAEAGGVALRYGALDGGGSDADQVGLVRRRRRSVAGGGPGLTSWLHVDDAASATVLAVESEWSGVFTVVDDEPAPASEWLPFLAECVGAPPPRSGRERRPLAQADAMAPGCGLSNAATKRDLGWTLRYPSWRQGFKEEFAVRNREGLS